jgi:hypothetical protein
MIKSVSGYRLGKLLRLLGDGKNAMTIRNLEMGLIRLDSDSLRKWRSTDNRRRGAGLGGSLAPLRDDLDASANRSTCYSLKWLSSVPTRYRPNIRTTKS